MTIELSDELVDELGQLVNAGLYASEKEAILAAVEELLEKRYQGAE
jgi:Arc/MetJ-type ribon-helix-helix transcriptional regulator